MIAAIAAFSLPGKEGFSTVAQPLATQICFPRSKLCTLRRYHDGELIHRPMGDSIMPQGSKAKYTNKQKRQAEHIEEGYEKRGVSKGEAERRAWATVNKSSGGGKKSGSGRGKATNKAPAKKGGRKGGKAAAKKSAGGTGKKTATTRKKSSSSKKSAAKKKS
jgi:plasmid stabilization system protein ParE